MRALKYTLKDDNYDKAIKEFSFILEKGALADLEHLIYKQIGTAYYYKGSYNEAETALSKALELNLKRKGHDSELYQNLAYTYIKLGRYERALMFFEKAASFGSEGFLNRHLTNIEHVNEMKQALEKHKDKLPFMTAYFEQNKDRLSHKDNNKPQ
jgi:tetratricopeptide (TPR) repeat protein